MTTIVVAFLVWVPVASAWSWPVQGPVLQPFSYDEAHPYDADQHRGIDIGAGASGDPVIAPASGMVSFAGFVPASGESLTIETADGYSVSLTHLGSIGVADGASVSEGDAVATVGPSGAPEQSVPYVHLGIRLSTDPLGYLDPLGLLPAPESPPATPTPAPQPVRKAVPAPERARGGGLGSEKPAAGPPAVAAPAEPAHAQTAKPTPKPKPKVEPAGDSLRTDAHRNRRPFVDSVPSLRLPVVSPTLVHAIGAEPLALTIAPGLVAALLAFVTAFTRGRRQAPAPARIIPFRRELPLRRAA